MFRRVGWTLAVMLLSAGPAAAQDATMTGVVTDESNAVLPGAVIVVTSRATGRVFESTSNERGEYRVVGLPPGRYDTKVELAGFAAVLLSDVELLVGQNAHIPYVMKLAGLDETINPIRVRGIVAAVQKYYPDFGPQDFEGVQPWRGQRPVTPDGLPFVGRSAAAQNLVVATGHAMMGVSLAPVTGKLVADALQGAPNVELLSPDRYH